MQCGICARHKRHLTCPTCAQGAVWQQRTEYLFKTAERDAAYEKVQEHLEGSGGASDAVAAQREELQERLRKTRAETAHLKEALRTDKANMEKLRAENSARRRKLDTLRETNANQEALTEVVTGDLKRVNHFSKILYNRTAEARSFLCRDAASLVGLRLKRRKSGKVEYLIGGVLIPNLLTDLSVHPHTSFNVSLDHLAHLLVLVAHYLGLKLPHEVILSGRDNPFTMFRAQLGNRHVATRPLIADAPLSTMARENATAHSKFIEGVSMLALDIAWLCSTQGLQANDVEDAANIGHCMWKLLVAKDSTAVASPSFGRSSHATINGNLNSVRLEPVMAGFKLRYNLIADRIRYTLQGETMVADWDMVPEAEKDDSAVVAAAAAAATTDVKALRRRSLADALSAFEDASSSPSSPAPSSRPASTSGGGVGKWTRIRARNDS